MKYKTIILFLTIVLLASNTFVVSAAGLNISPISNDLQIQPGVTATGSFKVKNQESTALNLELEAIEFSPTGELKSQSPATVGLPIKSITLQPDQEKEIAYTITQPTVANYGSEYYGIQVKVVTKADGTTSNAVIASATYRINVRVVSGQVGLPILNFTNVTSPVVLFGNTGQLNYDLLNSTDYYSKPVVYNQILNPYGEIIYSQVLNDGGNLLTNGNKFSGNLIIDSNLQTVAGIYKFEVLAADSFNQTSQILKKDVLVITPIVLIGVIILIVVGLFLIYTAVKLRKNKKVKSLLRK